jgi:hypothetical protein
MTKKIDKFLEILNENLKPAGGYIASTDSLSDEYADVYLALNSDEPVWKLPYLIQVVQNLASTMMGAKLKLTFQLFVEVVDPEEDQP